MRYTVMLKTAVIAALAWGLTACTSTGARSAIEAPVHTVAVPTLPPVSGELLLTHARPAPPLSGSPTDLLEHAAAYGAYVGRLEVQTQGWRDWYRGAAGHE